jgi:hypothetical protein
MQYGVNVKIESYPEIRSEFTLNQTSESRVSTFNFNHKTIKLQYCLKK